MKKLKIIKSSLTIAYFGSPDFSADFLEKLTKNKLIDIKLVVTQPDRPVGRKQIITPTPVKEVGLKNGLEILEIKNLDLNKNLKLQIKNYDLCLVYAYASIIPKELLELPKYGFWCIHPSLLPKYRGTSPMAMALMNGDRETGVTIIKIDEKVDHGPIIAQEKYRILPNDRRPDLEKKLTDLAFKMFRKIIKDSTTKFVFSPLKIQNHSLATYTKKLTKQDGFIPFKNLKNLLQPTTNHQSLVTFYNLFRGLYPWPGIWTLLPNGKRLKITEMKIDPPAGGGKLEIVRVQLEGKKEVNFTTFNKAYKVLN